MLTISELYKDDLQGDPIFVLEYPLSPGPDEAALADMLVNRSRYLLDDAFRERDYASNRIEKPHRNLPVLGRGARAFVHLAPLPALVAHWRLKLGPDAEPRYASKLGEAGTTHVVMTPLEDLEHALHAVDPDVHFEVYSKAFIGQISCPQADVLNELALPSVLKVWRSSGGHGTWMIESESEYRRVQQLIAQTMPHADTVLTRQVQRIAHDYCCHTYVSRSGALRWIGVTEKVMDAQCTWQGATFHVADQAELERDLRPTCAPVVDALHRKSYFGIVGIDVIVDAEGRHYVVDINPRILGSTPLVLSTYALHAARGWLVSVFLTKVIVKGASAEALIARANATRDADVIVYSLVALQSDGDGPSGDGPTGDGPTGDGPSGVRPTGEVYRCQIGVFAMNLAQCRAIAESFHSTAPCSQ